MLQPVGDVCNPPPLPARTPFEYVNTIGAAIAVRAFFNFGGTAKSLRGQVLMQPYRATCVTFSPAGSVQCRQAGYWGVPPAEQTTQLPDLPDTAHSWDPALCAHVAMAIERNHVVWKRIQLQNNANYSCAVLRWRLKASAAVIQSSGELDAEWAAAPFFRQFAEAAARLAQDI